MGFLFLDKDLLNHWLWKDKPFARGQAWIDMIALANFASGKLLVRGILLDVERGQLGWSQPKMAARWGWSLTKLRMFFKLLEKEKQIIQQKNNVTSIVTIVNYELYQSEKTQKENRLVNRRETEEKQKLPIEEESKKKEEEVKKKKTRRTHAQESIFSESPLAKWEDFRSSLSSWPEAQARYYFQRFVETEQMHPGKYHYARWDLAAVTWDRRNPQEWKGTGNSRQPMTKTERTIAAARQLREEADAAEQRKRSS